MQDYVHGYSQREAERLADQASGLSHLLHHDSFFLPGSTILEPGCGIGAQTQILAQQNPQCQLTSVDISEDSLSKARKTILELGLGNVQFIKSDLFELPFQQASFDHLFICFLLEHLQNPIEALIHLKQFLKPGGEVTVIEGDHGSCYFHPETPESRQVWQCLIDCQATLGANSLIGRQLYPLVNQASFDAVTVQPRYIYVDETVPESKETFVGQIIIPMVAGVKKQAIKQGMIDETIWELGMADLEYIRSSSEGTFLYTFFKAKAYNRP